MSKPTLCLSSLTTNVSNARPHILAAKKTVYELNKRNKSSSRRSWFVLPARLWELRANRNVKRTEKTSLSLSVASAAQLRSGSVGAQLTSVTPATSASARAITSARRSPTSCPSARAEPSARWVFRNTRPTAQNTLWAALCAAMRWTT